MSLAEWSLPRLIFVVVAWLIGFPVLLFVGLALGFANVGLTLPSLIGVLALWIGPAVWLIVRWRRGRGGRAAGAAA